MFCKNCGKEISDDSKFCTSCGCNLVSIEKDESMPEQTKTTTDSEPVIEEKAPSPAENADENEQVAEEKETESENVQKNTESAENAPETLPSQSGGVSSVIDIEKIKEKISEIDVDKVKEKFSEIDVDEVKDKTKSFAKKEVENYKNFKNLSLSQKIVRVLIPAIVLIIIIAIIVPNSPSDEDYISSARSAVSEQLKAPATATFSNEKIVEKDDYGRVLVTLSVDSQNSFGAYVRGNYAVVIESYNTKTDEFIYYPNGIQEWTEDYLKDIYILNMPN